MASDPTTCATCLRRMVDHHDRVRVEPETTATGLEMHILWFCSPECEAQYQARTERPTH